MADAGDRLDDLVRIMATLRSPGGCPWDREQTLRSLRPFLLEETYEALAALDHGDMAGLREELGDLLFEIVFLARIAEEGGHFTLADAAADVGAKLVRRHPHVFGDEPRLTKAGEVIGKWEAMKAAEGKGRKEKTLLSGVPVTLPSLLRAYEYGSRAAAVGFDWSRAADVVEKIEEETREIRELVEQVGQVDQVGRLEEEVGDLLFAIANLSRKLGVEPEAALRRANDKFRDRFGAVEACVTNRGERLQDKTLDELDAEWRAVKARETR
jgi:MazG family protein